ncbi:hypothetical protein [Mucilaginibacter celer]|uniref:Uncharacterized protein n=1 Tax=Mucilaginibacter celer TaxID=2305508 RepID=A0A494VKM0_9SPHI|nr:hypothetical protein [Mucilaginibacter celer]AYL94984.1 hypothetical protein HYN43_006590 [Mucilaginibacter celer]
MEFDNNDEQKYSDDDYVDIYSRRAIFWFSTIFNVIFGGVLLSINLRLAGFKRAASQILFFSVFYEFAASFAVRALNIKIDPAAIKAAQSGAILTPEQIQGPLTLLGVVLVLHATGGLILSRYFFKKYFPDDDYYAKPVLSAIFFAIMITLVLNFLIGGI